MRHFGRIFIGLVIKKILERSKTFQVLMRAIAVIDEESLVKLGSDGGEGISGEGIPVVKFFTQGSVSSLHAAVILGLRGGRTMSGIWRSAQACSNSALNSDPPST